MEQGLGSISGSIFKLKRFTKNWIDALQQQSLSNGSKRGKLHNHYKHTRYKSKNISIR